MKSGYGSTEKTYSIDMVLEDLVKDHGFEPKIVEQKVFVAWRQAVGDMIARNTQPIALENGRLTVYTLSHPLVTELSLLQNHIIQKINDSVGKIVVRALRFKVRTVARGTQQPTQRSDKSPRLKNLAAVEISADVLERVNRALVNVEDPELKESLRRLFISQSQREAIDASNSRLPSSTAN